MDSTKLLNLWITLLKSNRILLLLLLLARSFHTPSQEILIVVLSDEETHGSNVYVDDGNRSLILYLHNNTSYYWWRISGRAYNTRKEEKDATNCLHHWALIYLIDTFNSYANTFIHGESAFFFFNVISFIRWSKIRNFLWYSKLLLFLRIYNEQSKSYKIIN